MAAVDLPLPRAGSQAGPLPGTSPGWGQVVLDSARGYTLWIFDAGLACCAVECAGALARAGRPGPEAAAPPVAPAEGNVLVVAGTVTDKLAPLVLQAYQRLPEPRFVLSFGACANSGGPYWDSYCVTKGVDQIIPVDVYLPGCPPRPEALRHGLDLLAQRRLAASPGHGQRPEADPPEWPR